MSQTQDRLFELIWAKSGVRPKLDDTLDALKIDSLAMAELTADIEKSFGIRVTEDIVDITTIGDLVAYIDAKVGPPPT